MDYQDAENQVSLLQQQSDQIVQGFKGMADKMQAKIPDAALARELVLDLREAALAVQKQNQAAALVIQQMAQYIHMLENNVTAPQPGFQTRGWAAPSAPSVGGGFLGNVMTGLGLGAGFTIAEDAVNDIFKAF